MFWWNNNFQIFLSLCISLLSVFTVLLICIWCFSCNTAFVFKRLRICYGACIINGGRRIIRFIAVIIPQTVVFLKFLLFVFLKFLLYSSTVYIGITTSRSSALSIKTLLIFDMQLVNGGKTLILMSIIHLPLVFCKSNSSFNNNIRITKIT